MPQNFSCTYATEYKLTTDIIVASEYSTVRYTVVHNVFLSVGLPMLKL